MLRTSIDTMLNDQYLQSWHIDSSSKASSYKLLKNTVIFETYLSPLEKITHWCPLLRFRLSNHNLPTETGRWKNVLLQNIICPLCSSSDIGDKFHYIFTWSFFKNDRKCYLPPFCLSKPNII